MARYIDIPLDSTTEDRQSDSPLSGCRRREWFLIVHQTRGSKGRQTLHSGRIVIFLPEVRVGAVRKRRIDVEAPWINVLTRRR